MQLHAHRPARGACRQAARLAVTRVESQAVNPPTHCSPGRRHLVSRVSGVLLVGIIQNKFHELVGSALSQKSLQILKLRPSPRYLELYFLFLWRVSKSDAATRCK